VTVYGDPVWLVGIDRESDPWEVAGIFPSQPEAEAICKNDRYFVMRVTFGVNLGDITVFASDDPASENYCYFPKKAVEDPAV